MEEKKEGGEDSLRQLKKRVSRVSVKMELRAGRPKIDRMRVLELISNGQESRG